jgi:hypothetical protein
MKRHREGELRPGQYDRVQAFEHHAPSIVSPRGLARSI